MCLDTGEKAGQLRMGKYEALSRCACVTACKGRWYASSRRLFDTSLVIKPSSSSPAGSTLVVACRLPRCLLSLLGTCFRATLCTALGNLRSSCARFCWLQPFKSPRLSVHAEAHRPPLIPGLAFPSDEEVAPKSQPCTPQPGSENVVEGSRDFSSDNSDSNNAASATSGRAATAAPDDAAQGAGSSQSAFSAIFRRYLTATALPPAIPASAAAAHGISPESCSHHPQQQQQQHSGNSSGGDISGISTAFCSTATEALSWDEEEKRGENAALAAPAQGTSRPGVSRFLSTGSGNVRSETAGAGGGRDRAGSPPATWRARVWARLRSVGGGALGTVQDAAAAAGVPSDIGSVERSSEDRMQSDTDRWWAPMAPMAGSLQLEGEDRAAAETMSHRRRAARRLAGSSRGRGRGGEPGAPGPDARDDGRSDGGGVAAGSGCDGGGAGAGVPTGDAGSDSRVGNHDGRASSAGQLWVPEVVAAGVAVGAVAEEVGGTRQAGGTVVRRTAEHSLAGGGGIAESATACANLSADRDVAAATAAAAASAACTNPAIPCAGQHHLDVKNSVHAGNERGGGEEGGAEIEVGACKGENSSPLQRETGSKSPVLPRARILWRAFSEVDHDTITENHRLAGLRHLARFAPPPGIENPPMCYVPPQG